MRWVILLLLLTLPGFAQEVVVASQDNLESRLLAEILAQTIEAKTELAVRRQFDLGSSKVCFEALNKGEIHFYPEYTGSGLQLLGKPASGDSLESWFAVQEDFEKKYELRWLKPFGFDKKQTLALISHLAQRHDIRTVSDLRGRTAGVKAAATQRFISERLAEFSGHYELELEWEVSPDPLAQAPPFELVLVDNTDWRLVGKPLVVLEDDLEFFASYIAAPLTRQDVLEKYPELNQALAVLSFAIDETRMRQLLAAARAGEPSERQTATRVAREFLRDLHVEVKPSRTAGKENLLGLVFRPETLRFILEHLWLTLMATVAASFLGIPLGIYLSRRKTAAQLFLGLAAIVQTIPSLAMLALLIPLAGLGGGAAIAALVLYALLPIMRNTYTGIRDIDEGLYESALALGLGEFEMLTRIQLPLAVNDILGGVRISAVISVRVACVAAFIGAGGLGEPILVGLQTNNAPMVFSGAIPAAVLAVVVDWGLGLVERAFEPHYATTAVDRGASGVE